MGGGGDGEEEDGEGAEEGGVHGGGDVGFWVRWKVGVDRRNGEMDCGDDL
jgi:hypothetical protein